MRQTRTKEGRAAIQQAQFTYLTEKGWTRETYKGLEIFTNTSQRGEKSTYDLKIFRDNISEAIIYYYYNDPARRAAKIEEAKKSYDARQEWKAKNQPRRSGAAECATAIREELKAAFPGVKFTVKSSNFAGGDSVSIHWEDGPTSREVEAITGKYQKGDFNGMEDIYEYKENHSGPGAKYVTESRSMSEATRAACMPDAERIFSAERFGGCYDVNNFIYRIFCQCSIPTGATITGIEPTGATGGLNDPATFYRIGYTLPEVAAAPVFAKVETEPGKVNIIQYSEKAIAVIGDTRPIKDKLKALGGSFNFRLSCGPGWIFPAGKLDAIREALTTTPQPQETTLKDEINKTLEFFQETDLQLFGQVTPLTLQCIEAQNTPAHV